MTKNKKVKYIIVILIIYVFSSLIYNNLILDRLVENKYDNCDIINIRKHGGGWNILQGSDIGSFYKEYTLHDLDYDVTFTDNYKHNIIFPFFTNYHFDVIMPTREEKIAFKEWKQKYKDDFSLIFTENELDCFSIDINSKDYGSEFPYLWIVKANNFNSLYKSLNSITEYIEYCYKEGDYNYLKFYALICIDEELYEKMYENKELLSGSHTDEYIESLTGMEADFISSKAYDRDDFNNAFFNYQLDNIIFSYSLETNMFSKEIEIYKLR